LPSSRKTNLPNIPDKKTSKSKTFFLFFWKEKISWLVMNMNRKKLPGHFVLLFNDA
jgi:hypothetical protein